MKTLKMLPISLLSVVLTTIAASTFGQEVIPITATLPIKAVGDSCSELNLGTAAYPNLIAAEGVAITADRALLLTCQSGTWKSSSKGLGVGQTWQNVTASRTCGPTYTNATGAPIQVSVDALLSPGNQWASFLLKVDGIQAGAARNFGNQDFYAQVSAIVPNGSSYSAACSNPAQVSTWTELR